MSLNKALSAHGKVSQRGPHDRTYNFLSRASDFHLLDVKQHIIINILGQIENRPLENTRFAGRKCINGPAADCEREDYHFF